MARNLTCPQGHRWEVADDNADDSPPCPFCGGLANTLLPQPLGRLTHPAPGGALQAGETLVRPLFSPPDTAAVPPTELEVTLVPASVPVPTARRPFAGVPAVTQPSSATIPGYEILGLLGRGGMGVVYKANQLGLKRLVALKMILAGPHADRSMLERFRTEGEWAARLQHPNIVQVYEVGEHNGLPFFSLEYVPGGGLDRLLAGQPQPGRPTAELVETLARAMHYAHERGIVHRDLKPANILIAVTSGSRSGADPAKIGPVSETPSGPLTINHWPPTVPKIADFGLAKQLEADSHHTRSGTLIGTPSYMAPEQAAGRNEKVGPAADTYALGAILYECLTGRPPFRAATGLDTVMQVIHEEPVPPQRLNSRVERDLEVICLKCLRKEPARRYGSALELAEDLHRFVVGEPIRARPASLVERTLKWGRRRPAVVALLAVSLVALVTLLVAGFWFNLRLRDERDLAQKERQRAENNFARALRAVDQMLTEVAEVELIHEPRMEQKRRKLLQEALRFYQEFLQEKSSDPLIRRETSLAYKRLADIQRLLGQNDVAQQSYQQAIALLEELVREFPDEPRHRYCLAESHNFLGEVLRTGGRNAAAETAYHQAGKILQALADQDPTEPNYRKDQARVYNNLGILHNAANQLERAQRDFDQAIGILKALQEKYPEVPAYKEVLAKNYLNLGPVLRLRGQVQQADEVYRRAIRLLTDLKTAWPDVPEHQQSLAVALNNHGVLLRQLKRPEDGLGAHLRALELLDQLTTKYPTVPVYRKELAATHNSLGLVRSRQGEWSAAQGHWERARTVFQKLVEDYPDNPEYCARLGMACGNLGWRYLNQKRGWRRTLSEQDLQQARIFLTEGVHHLRDGLRSNSNNPLFRRPLCEQLGYLIWTVHRQGDQAAADHLRSWKEKWKCP